MAGLARGSATSFGHVTVHRNYADVPLETREKYFGTHWKDHRYLGIVERTLANQFSYFYLLLSDHDGNTIGLQPGFVTRQDLALGLPGFFREIVNRIRKNFPNFLQPRMVFLGSPAANGKLGGNTSAYFALEAANIYAREEGISFITAKEFPMENRRAFADFGKLGFVRIASYPGVMLDLDCRDFEDYLATQVGSTTRKSLRRKFRSLEEFAPIRMECVQDVGPHLTRIYELYLQVFNRAEEKFEKLTPEFFSAVATELSDRARFFLWWQSDRIIAFSLCFVHDGIFYDDYIGFDNALSHDLHLYYVTFRDQMEWAIQAGLRAYYSTPMSYEPKLRLGFRLVPLDLYVRHTSPVLNWFYGRLAVLAAPTANDPHLPQFENFSELNPVQT